MSETARIGEEAELEEADEAQCGRRSETGRLFQRIGAALRKERLVTLSREVQGERERVRQDDERVERGV